MPASFWNSNYIPPPAPTHHQVRTKYVLFFICLFFNFAFDLILLSCLSLCPLKRFPNYIQVMVATQLIRGYHMQHTMVHTLMQHMHMQLKLMPIIIIWHNMAVYCGYHNIMDTVLGKYFRLTPLNLLYFVFVSMKMKVHKRLAPELLGIFEILSAQLTLFFGAIQKPQKKSWLSNQFVSND